MKGGMKQTNKKTQKSEPRAYVELVQNVQNLT